ncbi:hypothetical protein L6Q79_16105, partial [bacterium]|nr:hypothetical protein [bacterium]
IEKQIDGEERSAKIEYKLFQNYPIYFEVYIYPTNIFEKDECLVVSSIDSYDFEQEYLGEYGVTKNKLTTNRILSKHRTHKHPLLKNVRVR